MNKITNGKTVTYSRKILNPLLIAKSCGLKIQSGAVRVEKADGSKIDIDFGKMPDNMDCNKAIECSNVFTVTIDGISIDMEFVDGKRVRAKTGK